MQEELNRIVENCQRRKTNHVKNIKLLRFVFNSNNYEQFLEAFLQHVENAIQSDYKNPYVRNVLEFLAMFVSTVGSTNSKEANKDETTRDSDTGSETEENSFLRVAVERVIQYHRHKDWVCRYHTCSFLCMTLQNTEGEMNDNVIDLIQDAMLECIQDSKPLVRLEAVRAIHKIQDPSNPYCPVVAAILKRLTDPNPKVRKEAIRYIAPTAKTVIHIKDTVFDKDPGVRCNAFAHVANLSMKYFKIAHRQEIMWAGFAEGSLAAKKKFKEYLLPKWLTSSGGSYIKMLQAIKLDAEEKDIKYTEELSQKIVEAFFETKPITELIESLPLNENKVIPENDVSSELVLYWNMLVKHLRKSDEMEEYLGQVLPELTPFCQYIDQLITNRYSKVGDDWEKVNFQYLLYHLFDMAAGFDLSEEMGRRTLDQLIKTVISKHRLQPRLLNKLIQIDSKSAPNIETFTTEICAILSEIWQPMTEQPVNEHEIVEKKYEISNLKVQINIMQENQDTAVNEKRFDWAHELTQEINDLKVKLEQLQAELKATEQARTTTHSSEDPEILCWCLELLASLLAHGNVRQLSPSLITCLDEFLLPLVQSSNVDIQIRAFKCLADYCLLDRKLADEHLKTLGFPFIAYRILPNYHKEMMIDSIKVLTDLIRLYGTCFFDTDVEASLSQTTVGNRRKLYSQSNEDNPDDTPRDNPLNSTFILAGYLEMIDDEDDDIRVTALTLIGKLMLTGFPVEPIMLTRLVLKWISPTTRKSFQIKLGNVFSKYIAWVSNARQTIAQSIVTILTTIAEAPRTSPLADIDVDDVLGFLVCVTDSHNDTNLIHTSLAKRLLQEISMKPTDKATIYFSKMLNLLKLPSSDLPEVKELINKANIIQETESLEKVPKKQLSKFVMKLLGQKADSTAASVNITVTTANTTPNSTVGNQLEDTGRQRRLSSVIEENSSENEHKRQEAEMEAVQVAPPKKRRIDLSHDVIGGISEIALNAVPNNGVFEMSTTPKDKAKTVSEENSSFSDPDVVPSSQDTQLIKPSAIQSKGQALDRVTRNKVASSSSSGSSANSPRVGNENARGNGSRTAVESVRRSLRSSSSQESATEPPKKITKKPLNRMKPRNRSLTLDESSSESLDRTPERRRLRTVRPTGKKTFSNKSSSENSISSLELPTSTNRGQKAVNSKKNISELVTESHKKNNKKAPNKKKVRNGRLGLDVASSGSVDTSPARRTLRTENTNQKVKRLAKPKLKFPRSDGAYENEVSPDPTTSKIRQKELPKKTAPVKKVNKLTVPTKPLQKTAQVKRKKLRKSKSTSDESKENIQESDTSMDQCFHTFLQPDQFQPSLIADSEFETSPVRRSSRRLQVVDSETSSDENLSKSARRSTRSP